MQSVLILGDVHVPYEDPRAWALVLQAGRHLKPHHLWLLGDFVDFYTVSSHDKDPARQTGLQHEVTLAKHRLDDLDRLGAQAKVYVAGNHEDRLRRYLSTKAPELDGLVQVPDVLGLAARGYTYVPYKHHRKVGKLHLTHDVGVAGRYSVHKALDTYQHSVVTGHSHRLCYVVEGNAVGEQKLSAAFGWLGDRSQVDYMHQARAAKDWALGFGIGHLDPATGLVYLTPVPIVVHKRRYTCCLHGTLLTA